MLVLSRKKNEKIIIAGNITITVVDVRGDVVKLGITAPEDVLVIRKELEGQLFDHESREERRKLRKSSES